MTASFQDRDSDVRPADDLFRHVNGSWLSTTTIPDDQASTGSFRVLRDNSEAAVHDILEELTSGDAHELRQIASASTDHEVDLMAAIPPIHGLCRCRSRRHNPLDADLGAHRPLNNDT